MEVALNLEDWTLDKLRLDPSRVEVDILRYVQVGMNSIEEGYRLEVGTVGRQDFPWEGHKNHPSLDFLVHYLADHMFQEGRNHIGYFGGC